MTTTAQRPAPPGALPTRAQLLRCRDRLAARVTEQVGPDGLVRAPCESRVLESALLLHLLTVEEQDGHARERLTRYLKTVLDLDPPDAVQIAVARAALGEAVPGDEYARRALGGAAAVPRQCTPAGQPSWSLAELEHFTADRKRLTFRVLLAELGAAERLGGRPVPPEAFEEAGAQSWLGLQLAALKVLAHQGGVGPAPTARDWAALAPALRLGPVWEGNHLARLLGLLALRKDPVRRPGVRRALAQVAAELRPDGGLPFVTGLDVFATAIGGLALADTTRPTALLARMGEALAARQHPDGGFGFTRGVGQSDVDDTAYAAEFFRAAPGPGSAAALAAAECYLLEQQGADGGFPTFGRGGASEPAMTAAAVNALAPNPRCAAAVARAMDFLTARAEERGGAALLERGWSRNVTNVVFRTVLACEAAPGPHRALRRQLLTRLTETQHPDGGWGHQAGDPSDPISTAYAAIALSRSPLRADRLGRCLGYLVARQQPDGGYLSRPDQAGPRPLLYDVPALADVCVLLALAHAVGPGQGVSSG
ncbi:prenyltransferase/squalene oxidase repeat-containing protein [Kitasatospora sp. NPDC002227]|uniref:prenyltransferase/squalene oxidase repeat-containing protein n=1 Tax=Kitasatospora sp. NPDC002227 TaxID=3154773 RepID=UPI003328194B